MIYVVINFAISQAGVAERRLGRGRTSQPASPTADSSIVGLTPGLDSQVWPVGPLH